MGHGSLQCHTRSKKNSRDRVDVDTLTSVLRRDWGHCAVAEPALSVDRDLGQDQVARVAQDLLVRQVGAAGDGRHDRDLISVLECRGETVEVAGVLAVDEDVHEVADLLVLTDQVRFELRALLGKAVAAAQERGGAANRRP